MTTITRPRGGLLKRLARALFDNPVLLKELRQGLRERRIFVIQTIYLLLLGMVTLVYLAVVADRNDPAALAESGKQFFQAQFWMQFFMIILITPSLTCGLISTEKERHSMEMLLASRLAPSDIVLGKLGFAIAFMALLLFSAMPLTALIFFVGGVAPGEFLLAYFHLAIAVLIAAQIGLTFSARENKTNHATNQTYGLVVLGLIVFMFLIVPLGLIFQATAGWFPFAPELVLVLEIAYLATLMFLKTVNHLRPALKNIYNLCRAFMLAYLVNVALVAYTVATNANGSDEPALWSAILVMHLFLAGFFVHVPRFINPSETLRYRRSWFARPTFWCLFFAVGLFCLAGACHGAGNGIWVFSAAGLAVLFLFSYQALARCFAAMIGPKAHVPTLYYILVSVTTIVPVFWLGGSSDTYSFFTGIFLSPVLATVSLAEGEPNLTGGIPVAVASCVFYPAATALFYLAARKRLAAELAPAARRDNR